MSFFAASGYFFAPFAVKTLTAKGAK